jgi:hypothetical protein
MSYYFKATALLLLGLSSAGANAGEHQEKLASCLIKSTTTEDRNALVQWMFVAMSAHPLTSELATVPQSKREATTTRATRLFEKLMTETCGAETMDTIRFEGTESLSKAFETLGNLAMEGLMADPGVSKAITDMAAGMDQSKFEKMLQKQAR